MPKDKVFVTRKLPGRALEMIEAECRVKVNPHDRVLSRAELETEIRDLDGLLCLLTDTIDEALLDLNPSLRVIANYAVGYNNIDVAACTRRGIAVSNTPGVLTETTADLTWALILAVARRVVEADALTRSGRFTGWGPMMLLGSDVHGKTLGLIGVGRVGKAVARRSVGFGMRLVYHDPVRLDSKAEKELQAEYLPFDDLLRRVDYLSLHVPLTENTRHLIGAREIGLMKNSAFLINTTRGPVVDEKALVEALKRGKLAGAGLDVYEEEPELAPGLAKLNNTVLLPHVGSASVETRSRMAEMAAENLLAGLQGRPMPNLVNPEVKDNY